MQRPWLAWFKPVLGIDLGTERTRIWSLQQGLVVDEPTVLAIETQTSKVLAVGQDAAEMKGRTQTRIKLHYPIVGGKLYDAVTAKALLQIWLKQILGWRYLFSPVVMVSVAANSTQANRQAIVELFHELGVHQVYTIAQPLAAAIGAGVPIADASGTLLCQLGAGVVEAALISLGSLVFSHSTDQAGDYLDRQLQQVVSKEYQLQISLAVARRLKHELWLIGESKQSLLVMGQAAADHAPQELEVAAARLTQTLQTAIGAYLQLLKDLLSQVPPELTTDVLDKGMLLSGGLAQLAGLDQWLTAELGIPVTVIEEPEQAVIMGLATALEHLEEFKHSLGYQGVS